MINNKSTDNKTSCITYVELTDTKYNEDIAKRIFNFVMNHDIYYGIWNGGNNNMINESMKLNEFCNKNGISEGIWGISNSRKTKGVEIKIIPDSEIPKDDPDLSGIEIIPPSPLEVLFNHLQF